MRIQKKSQSNLVELRYQLIIFLEMEEWLGT